MFVLILSDISMGFPDDCVAINVILSPELIGSVADTGNIVASPCVACTIILPATFDRIFNTKLLVPELFGGKKIYPAILYKPVFATEREKSVAGDPVGTLFLTIVSSEGKSLFS